MNRFLQAALPMAFGAALSPFITPMGAAAVVGGLGAFRAKKVGGQDPLMAGLTAGLGAYGGANIATGLGKFGAGQAAAQTTGTGTTAQLSNALSGTNLPSVAQTTGTGTTAQLSNALSGTNLPSVAQTAGTGTQAAAMPTFSNMGAGLQRLATDGGPTAFMNQMGGKRLAIQAGMAGAPLVAEAMKPAPFTPPEAAKGTVYNYEYDPGVQAYVPVGTGEQTYFKPRYTLMGTRSAAGGGLMALAGGGDTKSRDVSLQGYSAAPAAQANNGNPFVPPAQQAVAMARPAPAPAPGVAGMTYDPTTQTYSGSPAMSSVGIGGNGKSGMFSGLGGMISRMGILQPREAQRQYTYNPASQTYMADGGPVEAMSAGAIAHQDDNQTENYAHGGLSDLGSYSDGGRMLRGPGDGVSDSIPATIGGKRPARLADNEFVIPARIVSELGNGSSEAGARQLYAMMDRVQKRRAKTIGRKNIAVDSKAYKELPA